jgi:intracellular sulfur oxidation DsrE/DsrF family protein
MKYRISSVATLCLLLCAFVFNQASASEMKHVVIQVSSADPVTQKIALNNAVNLQKLYGMDNVVVEIVAYGPGLSLMTKASDNAKRVESLAMQNINFSACMNTMKKVEKKTGKKPMLSTGVNTTPSGIARIVELQGEGYAYVRP